MSLPRIPQLEADFRKIGLVGRAKFFFGCFRNLLLVTYPYFLLTNALVPDLEPTRIGDAKFGCKILQPKSLY
jgi:hypothetical protein